MPEHPSALHGSTAKPNIAVLHQKKPSTIEKTPFDRRFVELESVPLSLVCSTCVFREKSILMNPCQVPSGLIQSIFCIATVIRWEYMSDVGVYEDFLTICLSFRFLNSHGEVSEWTVLSAGSGSHFLQSSHPSQLHVSQALRAYFQSSLQSHDTG